jgi:acyl-CoA thioester hydrolase
MVSGAVLPAMAFWVETTGASAALAMPAEARAATAAVVGFMVTSWDRLTAPTTRDRRPPNGPSVSWRANARERPARMPAVTPPFVHRIRVRYHECDAQGIVFNAHHFAYFDITLTELWREAFGSYDALVDAGSDVVVVDAAASFKVSPRFDDLVDVEMTIAKLGGSSMTSEFAERRDGELLVTGRMVHVFVDPATMTKQHIPELVRERLAPWTR